MVIPLLKYAIDREKRILMETVRITKEKISSIAETLIEAELRELESINICR